MFHVPDGMVSTESIDQCLLVQQRAGIRPYDTVSVSSIFFLFFYWYWIAQPVYHVVHLYHTTKFIKNDT